MSPSSRGQGSTSVVTINGSGFQPNTVFSFGQGSLATTNTVNVAGTVATVNLNVLPDAVTGPRALTATNPDRGTATLAERADGRRQAGHHADLAGLWSPPTDPRTWPSPAPTSTWAA